MKYYAVCLIVLFGLISIIIISQTQAQGVDHTIIGPTIPPHSTPGVPISHNGYNQTRESLWGDNDSAPSTDGFSWTGIMGGLFSPYSLVWPVVIMVLAGTVGAILLIKVDGDFKAIMLILILGSGAGSGGLLSLYGIPIEWGLLAGFGIVLCTCSIVYIALVGRG